MFGPKKVLLLLLAVLFTIHPLRTHAASDNKRDEGCTLKNIDGLEIRLKTGELGYFASEKKWKKCANGAWTTFKRLTVTRDTTATTSRTYVFSGTIPEAAVASCDPDVDEIIDGGYFFFINFGDQTKKEYLKINCDHTYSIQHTYKKSRAYRAKLIGDYYNVGDKLGTKTFARVLIKNK